MMAPGMLKGLCGKVGGVLVFGSANRPMDYSRYFSDLNVLLISGKYPQTYPWGYSYIVVSPDNLSSRCIYGDPLCIWVMWDSRLICGSLPRLKFTETTWTLDSLRQIILNNVALMYEDMLLGNNAWASNWAYHAVKDSLIMMNPTIGNLSDFNLMNAYKGSELARLLGELRVLRRLGQGLPVGLADRVSEALSRILGINLPTVGSIRAKASGDAYPSIQCDNYGCMVLRFSDYEYDYYYL